MKNWYWKEIIICGPFVLLSVFLAGGLFFHVASPFDQKAFANIHDKCGVLASDEIRTTSLRKISDCINRLSDIKVIPIRIGNNAYTIPRDGNMYSFEVPDSSDQCSAWCHE